MMSLVQTSLLDQLPMDNIDGGFDNNADNLHLSLVDMESYFNVANRLLRVSSATNLLHVKLSTH